MPTRPSSPALRRDVGAVERPTPEEGPGASAGAAPAGTPRAPYGDARDQLDALAARLRRATLDVVWRQWRAVGASTASTSGRGRLRGLVDPEALVLCSLGLVEAERRLADVLRDWVIENSSLLSVQRANNVARQYPPDVQAHLAWFAQIAAAEGKDARWRSLASDVTSDVVRYTGGRGAGNGGTGGDAVRANKPRAVRATLADPAALLLRLRLGFGVGAKADVLAFLLGAEGVAGGAWASVRALVHATGYTTAAVRRAADDMAAARLIRVMRGSPTSYGADRGAWMPVLQLTEPPPPWRAWHERFAFVLAFLAWADAARARPLSTYAFGARARDLMERHRPAFERDLVAVWSEHTAVDDWGAFVGRAIADLAAWMEEQA